jgi:BirA family biotin operon repressor/biotin-[acetyl-CoA-carboxylase] ligase
MWLSIVLYPKIELLPWLFAVCGLAVKYTLQHFSLQSCIKWPNDILVNNKKIAGILIEGVIEEEQAKMVCGIGLNINLWPAEHEYLSKTATSMREQLGYTVDINDVLVVFLQELDARYINTEIAQIRQQWKNAMSFWGRQVSVRNNDGSVINGSALDVDVSGRLCVLSDDGQQHVFSSGDLFLK